MLTIAFVWIHVLSVVLWFGGSALMAFVVGPALAAAGGAAQPALSMIATKSHRYYGATAGVAILSGLFLAWTEGRFSSPLVLTAIALAIFLAFWGSLVTGKRADALARAGDRERPAAVSSMIQAGTIEITAFFVAFTLMIAVRFGY